MQNVLSDSFESSPVPLPRASGLTWFSRPGLRRPVLAPLALLAIVSVLLLIAELVLHRGAALGEQSALHLGCLFAALTLGSLGMAVVLKSGEFDLSAGPIMFLVLTIVAWGIKEDLAVICVYGDNLAGANEKWQRNQAEIDFKKAGRGWPTMGHFYADVARNSRYLERLQYIRKSGAQYSPYSPAIAVLFAVGVALALGFLNGAMIRWLSIPSLFATLGTSAVALSCAQYMSNTTILRPAPEQVPYWLGLPQPGHVCLAVAAAVVVVLLLRFQWLETSVRPDSIEPQPPTTPRWRTIRVYTLAALLAAAAGICLVPQLIIGGAAEGVGWELRFVVAACIGGAMLQLQRGVIWGTVIGAALIALIDFGGAQFGIIGPTRDVLLVALFAAVLAIDRASAATTASPAHS